MKDLETLKKYWEFYEIEIPEKKYNDIIELFSYFEKKLKEELNTFNLNIKNPFYISPHAIIRIMQSELSINDINDILNATIKAHIYYINKTLKENGFIHKYKTMFVALDRIELRHKDIFIVFKTREENNILNRLDIISLGVPGKRKRNLYKIKGWENFTNEEKKNYFINQRLSK